MTDYGQGAEPFDRDERSNPEPDEIAGDDALVTEDTSDFSTGEGTVALAGIIIVGVWLVFEVITRQYNVNSLAVVLGAAAATVPRMNPESVAKIISVPSAMKLLGFGIILIGVVTLVHDITDASDVYDSVLGLIGAFISYVAYGMALVGSRQIEN